MMFLMGDVHAEFSRLKSFLDKSKELVIQLGDLGIGFPYQRKIINPEYLDGKDNQAFISTIAFTNFNYDINRFRYIRGNHDNPDFCATHPNYLGNFGIYEGIFFVSGARSIDQEFRTEDIDWWEDEELSITEMYKAIDYYRQMKPDIVITHDGPQKILSELHAQPFPSRSGQLFNVMMETHKPKFWYFAHHHKSWSGRIDGIRFRCLNCHETVKV